MSEWIKFDGSDEQIAELQNAKDGYLLRLDNGREVPSSQYFQHDLPIMQSRSTHYWIIHADPLREMKIRWAQTGQPVYWGIKGSGKLDNWSCDFIPWNKHDIYQFSFTPFED